MSLLQRTPLIGQARQREMLKSATTFTYSETPEGPLQAHFFTPPGFEAGDKRPLIIFLHGGFWETPMATQFVPHCLHFAERGAVPVTVETRVSSTHRTGPMEALQDLQSFLLWVKGYEHHFGVDPERVVLAGAAGGAFLALALTLPKLQKGEAPPVYNPAALLLFSALLDTTVRPVNQRFPDNATAKRLSPMKNVKRKATPMIFFHGKKDRVTPYANVEKFYKSMRWRRNKIELLDFENAEHSFFNFNVSDLHYELSVAAADRFLVDLGILAPPPVIDEGLVEGSMM
ncbi:alpha/beta hydrolase family protein [Luteolibacter luteus]|uniref:Alpha/beta hydrolase fold domain-containing protein n=1 Tax=Luteolibacter luteus TaxID=2728835 RepID=A0A858RSN7_9BACT|nr:alpha/beta hydrolase fold domain-containing protein [Luteolibacter luteus]QJE98983.1 alpha/beta hydrolase fold domain-containing protein [Luteolibacter luteus]